MARTARSAWAALGAAVLSVVFAAGVSGQTPASEARAGERPPALSEPQGLLAEPLLIQRAVVWSDRRLGNGPLGTGWRFGAADLTAGAGWPSAGGGFRHWANGDRYVIDLSAGVSRRGWTAFDAGIEMPSLASSRLSIGTHLRHQNYRRLPLFGEGPDSPNVEFAEYRLRSTDVSGYAALHLWRNVSVTGTGGILKTTTALQDVVAPEEARTLPYASVSLTADTRDYPGHPLRGTLLHVGASRFAARDDNPGFDRIELDGTQFVPLLGGRVVIAGRGSLIATPADDDAVIPVALQPMLGGTTSLRSYDNYRFHDRSALAVTAEMRVALMTHVDAAVFVDAGNVASRVSDLNFDRRSIGAGLRLHSRRQTILRFDVAHGSDGWRAMFSQSEPLQLARLYRLIAHLPFLQ